MIGDAAAVSSVYHWILCFTEPIVLADQIYRTYVLWGRNWRVIALPVVLLIVSMSTCYVTMILSEFEFFTCIVSGYSVCGLYPSEDPNSTVFDPRLLHWITTFYSIAVVQSGLTTGLMAFRIWQTDRRSASYRTNKEGNLMPILRILIESASIQFMVEVILLSLYAANYSAQYLLLELVTPLVVSIEINVPQPFHR